MYCVLPKLRSIHTIYCACELVLHWYWTSQLSRCEWPMVMLHVTAYLLGSNIYAPRSTLLLQSISPSAVKSQIYTLFRRAIIRFVGRKHDTYLATETVGTGAAVNPRQDRSRIACRVETGEGVNDNRILQNDRYKTTCIMYTTNRLMGNPTTL